MSSPNSIVVNCGATHVSVSVFSAGRGAGGRQLTLEKFDSQPLAYDYTDESAWLPALVATLRGIVKRARVSGPASVIVPGNRLLTKNIKVAQVEAARQRQMIAFSAQENLPDAANLVWDSQIIATDGVEAEVALFAHRHTDAVEFTEAVCATGLKPATVDAATLLDYQAYRLFTGGQITESTLILNIGARSTNLTFATPEGFGIQNISIGGNLLTQTVADGLGKSFQQAEAVKQSYFSDPDRANLDDAVTEILNSRAKDFSRRLAQDISRRIINQKRQNAGAAPVRLVLTGRGSLLPGLAEFLSDSLKLPAEFFDPASAVRLGRHAPAGLVGSASAFQMAESVGEAARLVFDDAVGVNLIPPEIAARMEFARKKPWLVIAALLFAAAPVPFALNFYEKNAVLHKDLAAVSAKLGSVKDGTGILADREKIAGFCGEIEARAHRAAVMSELDGARDEWFGFLGQLQEQLVQEPLPQPVDDEEVDAESDVEATGRAAAGSWTGKRVWIERLDILRNQAGASKAAAPAARSGAKAPPASKAPATKPVTQIRITVRALLENVAPDGTINAEAAAAKFREVESALKRCSLVQKVEQETSQGEESPNLPRRTFLLTLKHEQLL